MSIILDILLAVIIVLAFRTGAKKGLVKSIRTVAAFVLTLVLVAALKGPAIDYMSGTDMAGRISGSISDKVHIPQGGGVNIAERLNLPQVVQGSVNTKLSEMDLAVTSINDAVSSSLTGIFMTIIVCIGLFIIIRLLLMFLFMIFDAAAKLPVIRGANKMLGGLLGVVSAVFIIFIALGLVSLFAPADSSLFEAIDNTYAVKYFYNYNILLQLFMKI